VTLLPKRSRAERGSEVETASFGRGSVTESGSSAAFVSRAAEAFWRCFSVQFTVREP
jgi:hypothetical protein